MFKTLDWIIGFDDLIKIEYDLISDVISNLISNQISDLTTDPISHLISLNDRLTDSLISVGHRHTSSSVREAIEIRVAALLWNFSVRGWGGSRPIHSFWTLFLCPKVMRLCRINPEKLCQHVEKSLAPYLKPATPLTLVPKCP